MAPEKTHQVEIIGGGVGDCSGSNDDPPTKVPVQSDFTLASHPEVYVIGELASYAVPGGGNFRGTADVAILEGKHVGDRIR